jgi:hypothetical protein
MGVSRLCAGSQRQHHPPPRFDHWISVDFAQGGENSPRHHLRSHPLLWLSCETETPHSRYVLPQDLNTAIKQLPDPELDRLVTAALEERARRKKPPVPEEGQRKRRAEADAAPLPQRKLNAVRAAFKAGVTPALIAREFGLSRSDVQSALTGYSRTR